MAIHSNTLDWKIPWTEEPGKLQFMGLHRVGHDWVTSLDMYKRFSWTESELQHFISSHDLGEQNDIYNILVAITAQLIYQFN